jgi:hypothetical protein
MKQAFMDLFVNQHLSSLLHAKGLTRNTAFEYRIYNDSTYICSPQFDYLGLYKLDIEQAGVCTEYRSVPAYTVSDMLSILPEWGVNKLNDKYEACTGSLYPEIETQYADRYADALGKCVLEMLNKRVIPVENLNSLITNNK